MARKAKPAKPVKRVGKRASVARSSSSKANTPSGKARTSTSKPPSLVTIDDYIRYAATWLKRARVVFAHGTTDPVAEAAFLVGETLGLHPDNIERAAARRVSKAGGAKILDLVERRISTRKPAAYLVNTIYMRGLPFYIDERTIVPRSFIGEILDAHFGGDDTLRLGDPSQVTRVLDLCTGSGCLAVLAAHAFPHAQIDAVDLSSDALEVAKRNVADHKLANRIRLLQGDLFAPVGAERYDLIISNPPYVDAEGMAGLPRECEYEPRMAFDGGVDGIDLVQRILAEARAHLNDGGGLLCEVGRCRDALETAYPRTPFLWLDTEESEGEVFWLEAAALI